MPRALVVKEDKKLAVEEIELPKFGPEDLLIKVTHVAQNPTDWKHVHFGFSKPGSIVGCDFAGVVVEVGAAATGKFSKNDLVAGCVHGGLDRDQGIPGAYSEYVVQNASLVFHYPASIAPESIATVPLAAITAALGLFHEIGIHLPPCETKANVLVWAGSTSVGQYAIQLAKAAGCFVITTASPARHEYLKELGADLCFDYRDPDVISKIKNGVKGDIPYAIDCLSEQGSTGKTCAALSGSNPRIATILPGVQDEVPSHVKQLPVMMYTIFGVKRSVFGQEYDVRPQDKAFAEKFYQLLTTCLLPKGLLKPNRATIIPGGLNGVEEGFKRMMDNKVAAEKLVYVIGDTA